MCPFVTSEISRLGEAHIAFITGIRLLAGVRAHVSSEAALLGETCGTFTARIGPLIAMNPLVDPEIAFCRETLLAFIAAERFFTVMRELVSGETLLDSKLCGTRGTRVRLFRRLRSGAIRQSRRVDEFSGVFSAGKTLHSDELIFADTIVRLTST